MNSFEIDALKAELAMARCDYLNLLQRFNCRAGKLLLKGKRFIVVAHDEPYFQQFYDMIREHEKAKGRWTDRCEADYKAALDAAGKEEI